MESALLAIGHTVTLLTPSPGPVQPPRGVRLHTIGHWDDPEALTDLAPSLPDVDAVATIDEQCSASSLPPTCASCGACPASAWTPPAPTPTST